MKLKWIPLLAILSTNAYALDLELGLGIPDNPLYSNIPKGDYINDHTKNTMVGKIALSHTFSITTNMGIKVWAEHLSLAFESDPDTTPGTSKYGKNFIGTSLVIKLF